MTKDQFLQDPVRFFWSGDHDIPPEWIRDAWSISAFRDNVTYEFVRGVRKFGDLGDCQFWLEILPPLLSANEVVQLFTAIRDQAHQPENAWRPEFEVAFQPFADSLPPPQLETVAE